MSRKIIITLTEDQAWFLVNLFNETIFDFDGFEDDYSPEQKAFGRRVKDKILAEIAKI